MAKKNESDRETGPETADAFSRDLVTMYSRLTRSLEKVCGGDKLASFLAGSRSAAPAETAEVPAASLARFCRRLGLIGADANPAAFGEKLAAGMGEAVCRPRDHVMLMLGLFCRGDAGMDVKAICGATPQCQSCSLTRECDHYNNPRQPAMSLLTPAERLLSGNEQAVSDAELLAVAMFGEKGNGREAVVTTIMSRYGRLRAVFRAEAHEYQTIRDMGKPQTLRLTAVAALHRRLLAERRDEMLRIASAQDIHDRYAAELRDYRVEAAILLMLDQQNNVMRDVWFCDGSPNMAHVAIPDLLRPALREFACRIALVHNHPSGAASPSAGDIDFTRRLRSACDMVGLALVDHVIVAEAGYFSFAESDMLGR